MNQFDCRQGSGKECTDRPLPLRVVLFCNVMGTLILEVG